MSPHLILCSVALLAAGPAAAETGDAERGAAVFKRCAACHVVVNDAGETLAGRNAGTGPNLYDLAGRAAGSVSGFGYSKALSDAGSQGLSWDAESFIAFVQNPTEFLRNLLGDASARSKMSLRLRSEDDARDVYSYLEGLGS